MIKPIPSAFKQYIHDAYFHHVWMQSNENSWMFTNFEPHEFKEIPSVQYKHTFELFIEKSYGNFLYVIFWKIFEIFF